MGEAVTKRVRVSLLEVARHAGVSPATVSRVINNSAPVSDSIRAKVISSAETLGYDITPSRSNNGTSSRTVAVIVADLLNPFFPELLRGADIEARQDGTGLLLYDTAEDTQPEEHMMRMVASRTLDGVIIAGSRFSTDELVSYCKRYGIPLVVINRGMSCHDVACIRVDFEKAVYQAARHLLSLGHTRIGYLAGPEATETSLARRKGLEDALNEMDLEINNEWISSGFPNVAGGFQAMSALLSMPEGQRPTAVQAYNDLMALGALKAVRAHHLRVPEDISIVGFDDIALAAHANPPLTTVEQPKAYMGSLAMRMLRELMDRRLGLGGGFTLLESRLVVRETTGPVRE
jgi:DNA-binding LacI/PurR family transcriptional regulator